MTPAELQAIIARDAEWQIAATGHTYVETGQTYIETGHTLSELAKAVSDRRTLLRALRERDEPCDCEDGKMGHMSWAVYCCHCGHRITERAQGDVPQRGTDHE